ncbi:hypothetical protein CEF21_09920 [Bacillus sp. FJAT-42376]|uniref:hypothetical protein n=1 Tax=Bacillus sp. FJAT-42376 TaxID=2014076 RepID=UPI000F50A8D1|nr:hypothetical protein [Bacillus sp. FJAT-42376]AZB44816.1 hypothetical protein CEF21_09920 [Bacillus sp. FJAT-42376]
MKKTGKLEAILWSIALPGFGQFLNGHFGKGIVFIALEFLINMNALFNLSIKYSFNGDITEAFRTADLQWLMFYPCVYLFAMYDAYKFADGPCPRFSYLPFAFSAYFVTVGIMFSDKVRLFGFLPGPVWLPMLSLIPGLSVGFAIRYILLKMTKETH